MQYQAERPIGPNCERLISEGPQDPPYNLSRRMTNSGGPGSFFNISDISVVESDLFLSVETRHSAWLVFASIFALISLADLLLSLLRQRFRTEDDFESLAAIEIATPPHNDEWSKITNTEHVDAWHPGAYIGPSMDIRRRTRLGRGDQQEVQREISVEDQPVGGKDIPYSIARYLNQPPNTNGWERFIASQEGTPECRFILRTLFTKRSRIHQMSFPNLGYFLGPSASSTVGSRH